MHLLNSSNILIFKEVYESEGYALTDFKEEYESKDYAASRFSLNNMSIVFREAKTTPTKTGQFVTLWKRTNGGPIQPFEVNDEVDYFIIGVRKENNFGHFIFPKSILSQQKVLKSDHIKGKLAIRVYAPWDITNSKHAAKTQTWQSEYFLELSSYIPINNRMIRNFLSKN